jgi:hypothetical protein
MSQESYDEQTGALRMFVVNWSYHNAVFHHSQGYGDFMDFSRPAISSVGHAEQALLVSAIVNIPENIHCEV